MAAASEQKRKQRKQGAAGKRKKRERGSAPGRAELCRIETELFARQRIEPTHRISDHGVGQSLRFIRGNATCRIDQSKLLGFLLGIFAQLLALQGDLIL